MAENSEGMFAADPTSQGIVETLHQDFLATPPRNSEKDARPIWDQTVDERTGETEASTESEDEEPQGFDPRRAVNERVPDYTEADDDEEAYIPPWKRAMVIEASSVGQTEAASVRAYEDALIAAADGQRELNFEASTAFKKWLRNGE